MEKNDFGNGKFPSDESYLKKENINIHCETRRKTEYQRDDAACKNTREDSYQSSRRIINEIVVDLFKNILNIEERALQVRGIKDLTMTEMHAIEAIGIGKGRKMSEVAANLNVTMGTLTATLIKLEKKGYEAYLIDDKVAMPSTEGIKLLNEEKTLEEKEISEVMSRLVSLFKKEFNAELRS